MARAGRGGIGRATIGRAIYAFNRRFRVDLTHKSPRAAFAGDAYIRRVAKPRGGG